MKKTNSFFKANKSGLIAFTGVALIFLVIFYLYNLPMEAVLYPIILSSVYLGIIVFFEEKKRRIHHSQILMLKKQPANAIEELLPKPETIMEEDYIQLIESITGQLNAEIEKYEKRAYEMNDYYSTWVHQIKTPIASMKLNLQAEDSPNSRKLQRNLKSIEDYVEMVMSFLRLNSEHTDYVIKEENLKNIVKEALKKNSLDFIEKKLSIDFQMEDAVVLTDKKWISLVIEQILGNSLKYTNTGGVTISFDSKNRTLFIKDTGIGIDKSNLPRVFERGYTGFNGRNENHSSGIGLYICKSVCDNLHVEIKCESEVNKGTVMSLKFPDGEMLFD